MTNQNTENKNNGASHESLSEKQLLVLLNNARYKEGIVEDSDLSLLVTELDIESVIAGNIQLLNAEAYDHLVGCAQQQLEEIGDVVRIYPNKDDSMFPDPIHIYGIPGVYGVYIYGWGFDRFFDTEEEATQYADQKYSEIPNFFD